MHNISSAVQPVALETFGGLVTLASPDSLPEGASPRCYDVDFAVGGVQTRPGTRNVYTYAGAFAGPNPAGQAVSAQWTNPSAILANDGVFTSIAAGSVSGFLDVSSFAFALPATISVTGIQVVVKGYSDSNAQLTVQILLAGVPAGTAKTITLPSGNSSITLGGLGDLWDVPLAYSDPNSVGFGLRITASSAFPLASAFLDYVTLQVGQTVANSNFTFIAAFTQQNGGVKNLSLDANGDFWVEDVTNNPGVLSLALEGITPGAYANGVNGPDVEYIAFNDLTAGSDLARQYTNGWIDKISQVGPGASPVFTPLTYTGASFAISSITQPIAQSRAFSYFLQSAGPGSTSPGNVATVYYSDATLASADSDLVNAVNSGNPVYLSFSFTGAPTTIGPATVLVTSVGLASPPGQPRQFYYFTYVVTNSAYIYYQGSGHPGYTANYQRTLATITTTVPVPGLTVGNRVTVTGTTIAGYNTTWSIAQALNSASLAITQTSLTAGVATFSYAVVSGVAPAVGQLITITNTLNANGALNGVNLVVASVTGTTSGTFTINGFSATVDYVAEAEDAQGVTAGTLFAIEPGMLTLGTSTSPIYGNATGGSLIYGGSTQYISPGTKQGVCFFITRNGYWTAPSPPVTFTVPTNTSSIQASQIPIGPPNVVARGIAFTESGALGVPGANFFTLPIPIQYIQNGVTYTATSLLINDNTTTTATFSFADTQLLSAEAIDVQGNNLFNQIEIGNPGWVKTYASRNFYGLCQNKVQNFLNLSFDGGHLGGSTAPLGWTTPDAYGKLLISPVFGNSYYIKNTSGGTLAVAGLISQPAYQDFYQVPIIRANTAYSLRVTARCPSGIKNGNLSISLTASGLSYGTYTLPLSSMTSAFATFTGVLSAAMTTVPAALLLSVQATGLASNADVEIDRFEIFPTAEPVLTTTVFASYVNDPEAIDTDNRIVLNQNQQPVMGATELYDTLYFHKQSSRYSTQAPANLEPQNWTITEVSQKSGAIGINSYDSGEQWDVSACRNGIYLFSGGQPGKISQEIYQVWDAINWSAGKSIWVRNDVIRRRLYVGIPLPTPNFWLPNAKANAAPAFPNVILMLNYQGMDSGESIKTEPQMHTTMFGTLNAIDMRRKWTLWQIPSPYAEFVQDNKFYICNGQGNSKIYALDEEGATDDGIAIPSLYTTFGFVNADKAAQVPMLGFFRKRWRYLTMTASGIGKMAVRLLPNVLAYPEPTNYGAWRVPGDFTLTQPAMEDREATLNFVAQRTFVEFSGPNFSLSRLILVGGKDIWNAIRGIK